MEIFSNSAIFPNLLLIITFKNMFTNVVGCSPAKNYLIIKAKPSSNLSKNLLTNLQKTFFPRHNSQQSQINLQNNLRFNRNQHSLRFKEKLNFSKSLKIKWNTQLPCVLQGFCDDLLMNNKLLRRRKINLEKIFVSISPLDQNGFQ